MQFLLNNHALSWTPSTPFLRPHTYPIWLFACECVRVWVYVRVCACFGCLCVVLFVLKHVIVAMETLMRGQSEIHQTQHRYSIPPGIFCLSYVWHDTLAPLTCLIGTCDMTHLYVTVVTPHSYMWQSHVYVFHKLIRAPNITFPQHSHKKAKSGSSR